MSRASVRHIVQCSWWLTVTGMAIDVTAWRIVQHEVAMAETIEKSGTCFSS